MAEKSGIGRKKSGLERDLGAGNGKPALRTATQRERLQDGGAPLPIRPMVLSADPERIAHSLRALDLLERIDQENKAQRTASQESGAPRVPPAERRAS